MARTYDRLIRFYDSWFGDLLDEEKELTPEECWQTILAIRECQRSESIEPLRALPREIRRALQMRTLETQITKILERSANMRERGSKGGSAANRGNRIDELTEEHIQMAAQPPSDGIKRNYEGMNILCEQCHMENKERAYIMFASNYGEIGNQWWAIMNKARTAKNPSAYIRAIVDRIHS